MNSNMNIPKSDFFGNQSNQNNGEGKAIVINGRRMQYQGNGVQGKDLVRICRAGHGRRPVIRQGIETTTIDPNRYYTESELTDKKGRPVYINSMPDRSKGGIRYGEPRQYLSKMVITDQVHHLAANCFKQGVEFDEYNADWLVIPRYRLPEIWNHMETPLLIVFPTDYPQIPPVGFYMQKDLGISPNGHFYESAYHNASLEPIEQGWNWYCAFVKPGSWRPAPIRQVEDWRHGDNLWTYFTLISEVLSNQGE
ncbi:MAG: hypothetical protein J0665_18260 [Deltaproteobacteria bacterium]|nr:hypothetical protein [Deltaproteobacteria bacterium]